MASTRVTRDLDGSLVTSSLVTSTGRRVVAPLAVPARNNLCPGDHRVAFSLRLRKNGSKKVNFRQDVHI